MNIINKYIQEDTECVNTTGLADEENVKSGDVDQKELAMGIEVEKEHTKDPALAKQIALDHLSEDDLDTYYTNLKNMEHAMVSGKNSMGIIKNEM
jgi:hypothetical protein